MHIHAAPTQSVRHAGISRPAGHAVSRAAHFVPGRTSSSKALQKAVMIVFSISLLITSTPGYLIICE